MAEGDLFLILGDAHQDGSVPPVENFEPFRRLDGAVLGPEASAIRWVPVSGVSGTIVNGDCLYAGEIATQIVAAGGRTLQWSASARTITASTGSFVTDGYVAGMRLRVRGTTDNDGAFKIAAVSALVITLQSSDVLVDEGPLSSAATLDATEGPANRVTAAGGRTLTFNQSGKTITASSGSWIEDGYEIGHRIKISGSADNDQAATIVGLTATVITVEETTLADEGPLSSTTYIDGTFGPFGYIVDTVGTGGSLQLGIAVMKFILADTWESIKYDLNGTTTLRTTASTPATMTMTADPKRVADGSIADAPITYAGNQLNWKFQRRTAGVATWWDGAAVWGPAKPVVAAGGRTLTFAATGGTITASTGNFTGEGFKVGMDLVVTGTSSNNGTYEIAGITALVITLHSSETLVDEGPLSATATLNASQTTVGQWTEYCAVPNLNGYGRTFLIKDVWNHHYTVAPRGSNWKSNGLGRGIDPLFVDGMINTNPHARCLKYGGDGNGSIHVAELTFNTRTTDFTVGETLTGGTSGAKGTIYAVYDDGVDSGILYLTNITVSGFQSGETVTDDLGGSATTGSEALGWCKGGKYYIDALAEYTKAIGSTKWSGIASTGWTAPSASAALRGVILLIYVRDIQLQQAGTTVSGQANQVGATTRTFTTDYEAGLTQFIEDWKTDTGADPVFSVGMPAEDYQSETYYLRAVAIKGDVANVEAAVIKAIKWDTEGFEYSGASAAQDTPPTTKLWYESLAYDTMGARAWEKYVIGAQGFSPPAGAGVPLYVEIGQSQAISVTGIPLYLLVDGDGDVGKFNDILLSLGGVGHSPVTTVDGRRFIYNGITWGVYSHSESNSSPLGNGNLGNFGPEAGFWDILTGLHPDTGAYMFKMAQATSCMSRNATGQTGCWAKGGSNISATASGEMTFAANGTVTCTTAVFSDFIVGEFVQISGSDSNNIILFATALIVSVASDGLSIVLSRTNVVETSTSGVTIQMGPVAMYEYLLTFLKQAMADLVTQLGVFPDVQAVFMIGPAEGDVGTEAIAAAHQANLQEFVDDFREDFQTRTSGRDVAFVMALLTNKTPLGTDVSVASVRAGQLAVAAADSHIVTVETNSLPMQAEERQAPGGLGLSFGNMQQQTGGSRTGYGVHWTPTGVLTLGVSMGSSWSTLFANEAPTVSSAPEDAGGDDGLDDGGGSGGGALASAFEVETGSASETSNSYASVAQGDSYYTALGSVYWIDATEAEKQQALRRATAFIDDKLRGRWKGQAYDENQSLAWPRSYVYNAEGFLIDWDAVPILLIQSTLEIAELHLGGIDLAPNVEAGESGVTGKKVKIDVITIEDRYSDGRSANTQPSFTTALRKLSGLINPATGGAVVRLIRT